MTKNKTVAGASSPCAKTRDDRTSNPQSAALAFAQGLEAPATTLRCRAALLLAGVLGIVTFARANDEIPGRPQTRPIAITNAIIHTVSGETWNGGGVVVFDHGKITAVGKAELTADMQVIDAAGKHVYPGLFDSMTNLGLTEIDAVRSTVDQAEAGTVNPNVRAEVAVNPDSELIPVTRSGGVLLTLTSPEGGLISGQSAVLQLDGWTTEDLCLRGGIAMHVNWPNMSPVRSRREGRSDQDQMKARDDALKQLRQVFEDARAYKRAKDAAKSDDVSAALFSLLCTKDLTTETFVNIPGAQPTKALSSNADQWDFQTTAASGEATSQWWKTWAAASALQPTTQPLFDARWESMLPVLAGKVPLVVQANDALQIQSAVAFCKTEKLKLIIAGGYDAPLCAQLLKDNNVPVIVTGIHRLPQRRGDDYDAPYTLPERLKEAGVKFAIAGNRWTANVRNLPYQAATAAAYGLTQDDALRAITLTPAEILGVADRVGSIEVGKDATLIITDGNVLDTPTHVEQAFVQGRAVDLNDRQKALAAKYRSKYRKRDTQP